MSSFRKPICSAGRNAITTKAPRHQANLGVLVPWWFNLLRISSQSELHEPEERALRRRIGERSDRLACLLAILDRRLLRVDKPAVLRHELANGTRALDRLFTLLD